ncbi:MAG: hypothetical protein HY220_03980 [Candidatus Sungbacteria bacterium]|uniref:Uncharacterized protein n=1 Tax=Candidatus Sungiibacteriota bacterium TaxID=2750080 RepID=A0A9D6LSE1_9BACT|nr:hypothetical protein [Candidatus Sungbacteria bacterium]
MYVPLPASSISRLTQKPFCSIKGITNAVGDRNSRLEKPELTTFLRKFGSLVENDGYAQCEGITAEELKAGLMAGDRLLAVIEKIPVSQMLAEVEQALAASREANPALARTFGFVWRGAVRQFVCPPPSPFVKTKPNWDDWLPANFARGHRFGSEFNTERSFTVWTFSDGRKMPVRIDAEYFLVIRERVFRKSAAGAISRARVTEARAWALNNNLRPRREASLV